MHKKIILIGNITTGKTTTGKLLAKSLKCDFVELDQFRREHNKKKDQAGEDRAREMFLRKISQKKTQIIELTGSGRIWTQTIGHIHNLDYAHPVIVRLICPQVTLLKRCRTRIDSKYINPPTPIEWGFKSDFESLKKGIEWMSENICEVSNMMISTNKHAPEIVVKKIMERL